jgi:hypothetical protein
VEESGFGKYSNDPNVIAETVESWLSDPPLLRQLQQCAREAARPMATIQIAEDLAHMLQQQQTTKQEESLLRKSKSSGGGGSADLAKVLWAK